MYSGREFIGSCVGLNVRKLDAPEVMRTTAVSPMPRAMARMHGGGETGPGARQHDLPHRLPVRGAERLLASRRPPGTTRSATSPARAMIGTIVTAMATEAARPRLGQTELDDEDDVDEQAGQDLRQRRHRLRPRCAPGGSPGLRPPIM